MAAGQSPPPPPPPPRQQQQQQRGGGGVAAELDRGAEHGMKAQSVETLEGGQEAEDAARATCHMSVVINSCDAGRDEEMNRFWV